MATTADRVLGVLRLFTLERPEWTVEAAARELGLSQSTAYQYFKSLVGAGLIASFKSGRYVVGPAVIELDRQTRRHDPLILAAGAEMDRLAAAPNGDGMALLCRIYRLTVMCVDQRAAADPSFAVSYERGRPMPLFRGAASKIILAHLPLRPLRAYYAAAQGEIAAAELGDDWEAFRLKLRDIRRAGVAVTHGELDPGLVGLSAPIFAPEGEILGSIGLVLPSASPDLAAKRLPQMTHAVAEAGRNTSLRLRRTS